MKPAFLSGLLVAFALWHAANPALAENLMVIAIKSPQLILWKHPEGKETARRLPKDAVALPIPVTGVSKNLAVQISVDGTTGWVFGHHVKTNQKISLDATCDSTAVAKVDVGGTRGAGEGCK